MIEAGAEGETQGRITARRDFIVGAGLAGVAVVAAALRSRSMRQADAAPVGLEDLMPAQVGEWNSAPFAGVLIPQGEKDQDSHDEVVTRYYESSSNAGVMLLIAFSDWQAGNTELHRPEVCYPAAGFRLTRWPNVMLRLPKLAIPCCSMTAVAPERVEQLLYWSRVGTAFPTTSFEQRFSALRQMVGGTVPDGVLVRMSTLTSNRPEAMQMLARFAGSLLSAAGPELRLLLAGRI